MFIQLKFNIFIQRLLNNENISSQAAQLRAEPFRVIFLTYVTKSKSTVDQAQV